MGRPCSPSLHPAVTHPSLSRALGAGSQPAAPGRNPEVTCPRAAEAPVRARHLPPQDGAAAFSTVSATETSVPHRTRRFSRVRVWPEPGLEEWPARSGRHAVAASAARAPPGPPHGKLLCVCVEHLEQDGLSGCVGGPGPSGPRPCPPRPRLLSRPTGVTPHSALTPRVIFSNRRVGVVGTLGHSVLTSSRAPESEPSTKRARHPPGTLPRAFWGPPSRTPNLPPSALRPQERAGLRGPGRQWAPWGSSDPGPARLGPCGPAGRGVALGPPLLGLGCSADRRAHRAPPRTRSFIKSGMWLHSRTGTRAG